MRSRKTVFMHIVSLLLLLGLGSSLIITGGAITSIQTVDLDAPAILQDPILLQLGWPQMTVGAVQSSPTMVDLDGDLDMEIIIGSNDGNVYIWHHDGTLLDGWPQQVEYPVT